MNRCLPLVVVSALACACATNCPPPMAGMPPSKDEHDTSGLSADAASVMQADRDFAQVTAQKGVDGWVSFFADDGAQMPNGRDLVVGHAAIRAFMAPFFEKTRLEWAPERGEAHGDLGYTMGRAKIIRREDGKEIGRSKYLTVWKRQPDATWKVKLDIGNEDASP
jgi:ketosteroid isomerase-like protein